LDSTPQEPKKSFPIKNWHYAFALVSLYFIWGEFFPEPTFINQMVFNFALFYPIGFMNGYFKDPGGVIAVFRMCILFNLMTYVLVFAAGQKVPWLLAGVDFVTMFLFLYLGILMGKRNA
jgi:hypothetical protein